MVIIWNSWKDQFYTVKFCEGTIEQSQISPGSTPCKLHTKFSMTEFIKIFTSNQAVWIFTKWLITQSKFYNLKNLASIWNSNFLLDNEHVNDFISDSIKLYSCFSVLHLYVRYGTACTWIQIILDTAGQKDRAIAINAYILGILHHLSYDCLTFNQEVKFLV